VSPVGRENWKIVDLKRVCIELCKICLPSIQFGGISTEFQGAKYLWQITWLVKQAQDIFGIVIFLKVLFFDASILVIIIN